MNKLHVNSKLLIVYNAAGLEGQNLDTLIASIKKTLKYDTGFFTDSGALTGLSNPLNTVSIEDFDFYTNIVGPDEVGNLYCHIDLNIGFNVKDLDELTTNLLCSNTKSMLVELAELSVLRNEMDAIDGKTINPLVDPLVWEWNLGETKTFDPLVPAVRDIKEKESEVALPQRDASDPCF